MTLAEYNAHPGISATAIKAGRASMMQMRHAMITPRDSCEPSPAMRLGTLAHMALLEPTAFAVAVAVWDGGRKAGKEWEAFKAANDGKQLVTPDELDRLNAMQQAARASADARHFMSRVEATEVPMVWERKDIGLCKGRADCIGGGFLGDYKTARDIDTRGLFGQFERLGYIHQMAWYMDGLQRLERRQIHTINVLVQQNVPPFECLVVDVPIKLAIAKMGDGLECADDTCLVIARQYRICEALNSFPGRYSGVVEYVPPAWAGGADREQDISDGEIGATEL